MDSDLPLRFIDRAFQTAKRVLGTLSVLPVPLGTRGTFTRCRCLGHGKLSSAGMIGDDSEQTLLFVMTWMLRPFLPPRHPRIVSLAMLRSFNRDQVMVNTGTMLFITVLFDIQKGIPGVEQLWFHDNITSTGR